MNGGPVWWTDPYTAWAAKKRQDKKQKRKQEKAETLDPDIEARLKAMRGDTSTSATGGERTEDDIDARLRALRGGGGGASAAEGEPDE